VDRERFARLIAPVHDRAVAFARHLCRSRADGDDLFQEAALRALTKLGGLADEAAFRTWFYRIVITVHRNRARRAFWRRLIPLADPATPDPPDGAHRDYRTTAWSPEDAAGAARARAALAALPAVQREAIALFEIEGWTVDEIAALAGVSASAIKSRLARGRDRMRAFYQRHAPAAELPLPAGAPR
jgi:RNA polymerase sigma-70 factor, ECF subfamily